MSVLNVNIPKDRLTFAIEHGAAHMRPLFVAVRDCGIGLAMVPQSKERFALSKSRPTILFVGDDMREAYGPSGFHQESLRKFIQRCQCAVIVSSAPLLTAYAAAASAAVSGMDVILVETRLQHEAAWYDFIRSLASDISVLISTVEPEGGVH